MKPIEELFIVHRAHSHLFSDYEHGSVAYVGNGFGDNAVVGFVSPLAKDKVFKVMGITVSAFCESTVQAPPFIACGRAGNGLVVLEPRTPMTPGQLAYVAAFINRSVRWRFSWYWQTTADRLRKIRIPDNVPAVPFDVAAIMPFTPTNKLPKNNMKLDMFALGDIYQLLPGDYHTAANLERGAVPLVSCGALNNGIIGFVSAPASHVYQHRLTIALNGSPLTTKYHPYQFAAKDDVAICVPKKPMQLTTQIFIQAMLNRESWRYSYYRKCYMDKLRRFRIPLPAKNGNIDEKAICCTVEASPYWQFIETHVPPTHLP